MVDDRSCNGHCSAISAMPPHVITNGVSKCVPQPDGGTVRTVYDGFATIRAGGSKRSRARSASTSGASNTVISSAADSRPKTSCPGCCGGSSSVSVSPGSGGAPLMEPLWEERNGGSDVKLSTATTVAKRDSKIPWWEVATRRSRYRSCPAFSQASIVSALEQTLSDVTDQLDRLASSPDLKISEADELRKSAAILRRQSSAVSQSVSSGYFSLERQASCDSVSSINSSVSNATHVSFNSMGQSRLPHSYHLPIDNCMRYNEDRMNPVQETSKIKKKNWLRTSFRRAFGKNGRGRKVGKLNETLPSKSSNWDSISTTSREASQQHYHSCHSLIRSRQLPNLEPCVEHRCLIKDGTSNSEIVSRLQRLIQDKDRIITENKIELTVAQKTVKSQAEIIARLQIETTTLKEENLRLNTLVQNKYGTVSAPPVIDSPLNVACSNGIYATLSISKGKKVRLCVVENIDIDNPSQISTKNMDDFSDHSTLVGTLNIQPKTTWEQLDDLVAEKCMEYCGRLDPGNGLGLGRESILCYRVAEALRASKVAKPDLLPYGYCVGNVQGIHVWFKGPLQKDACHPLGNVSSVCFQSGVPSSTLKSLMPLLHETRRVILVGPEDSDKSAVAYQLARCYVASKGASIGNQNIVSFTVNGSNSLELCQLLASVASRSRILSGSQSSLASEESSGGFPPKVLIISDLHAASGVVETIQRCLPSSALKGPAIIATSQNAPILVTRLQVHCSFRWMGFSVQEEPIRGALGRLLRRPLLAAEISSGINLPDVHRTVDWLTRLWLHLNSLLPTDRPLGPLLLQDCPLDQEKAKAWFIQTWNRTLAPILADIVNSDPKAWVLSTIPWKIDSNDIYSLVEAKTFSTNKGPPSPVISTLSTKRSFQKRFFETSFGALNEVTPQMNGEAKSGPDETSNLPQLITAAASEVSKVLPITTSYGLSTTSSDESIYAKPLLTNGISLAAVEKVIYTKPPPVVNNKTTVLGSFSTFISNDTSRDTSRKYSIHNYTPVMYRRDKGRGSGGDIPQIDQNGYGEEPPGRTNESMLPPPIND